MRPASTALAALRRGDGVGPLHLRNVRHPPRLEEKIAAFFGFEAALSYVSCWTANEGLIPTIATAGNTIISDELNHASIIDGCRLAGAKRVRYKHGDMADLEAKLRDAEGTAFIVTDGVFSMEGSIAKLPEIVALAERYGAVTIVDDSHGTGVMGKTGRGTIEHFGLEGKSRHRDRHAGQSARRRGGRFRRGLASAGRHARPALAHAAVLERAAGDRRGERARARSRSSKRIPSWSSNSARTSRYFRDGLTKLGFRPLDGPSAIVPIIVGDTAFAIAMSDRLLKEGVFVTGFGFPVVPEGTARVRVQISSALTRDDLDTRARRLREGRPRARRHRP